MPLTIQTNIVGSIETTRFKSVIVPLNISLPFPIYGFYTNPRINLTFNVPYSTNTIEICNFLGLRLPEVCLELECARSRIFEKGMYGSSLLPTD